MRGADAEGRLRRMRELEAVKVSELEARVRATVATKNEVIDQLKDELARREAVILEVSGAMRSPPASCG